MAGEDLDDEYIANLLKEDAKKTSKNFALGLGGFLPTRYASKDHLLMLFTDYTM